MFGNDGKVKFIDFGFAIVVKRKESEQDIAGTPYYIAPEVLSGTYGMPCDIWSLGVCLYQVLTGKMPFDSNSQSGLFAKIKKGKFEKPKSISDEAIDLINKMITVDPRKRISARDATSHPWFSTHPDKSV